VTQLYANVIINNHHRSLDKPFQYLVPSHLAASVAEGSLVLIPFGNTFKYGYVIELSHDKQHARLKEIEDVLGPALSLNHEEMQLADWLSNYYLTTKIKALKMFIPVGAFPDILRKFKITTQGDKDSLSSIARELLNKIEVLDQWLDYDILENELKSYKKAYKELLDKGYIEEHYQIKQKERRKDWSSLKAVLNVDMLDAKETDYLKQRAPKQWETIKIVQESLNYSVQDLIDKSNLDMSVLKKLIDKGIIAVKEYEQNDAKVMEPVLLNKEQQEAFEVIAKDIENKKYAPYVLHGVTGSGKTEVYMEIMEYCLQKDLQCILALPEIFLTLQIVKRLEARFPDSLVILHSKLTPKERYEAWAAIKFGHKKIIVGARSAVFAPVKKLGAIIIDEEHDTSYKQDNDPKYNAKEVALKRAMWHNCPALFGSATPSLETFLAAQSGKMGLLNLPKRVNDYKLPTVEVIDMKDELRDGNLSIFSKSLQEEIKQTLANNKQVILYLNKRGFASFVLCRDCGYILKCLNCEVSLTYHHTSKKMLCHYCGFGQTVPKDCPQCASQDWKPYGLGTQKVEHEFKSLFPGVNVMRIDGDIADKKEVVNKYLDDFSKGKTNVLIGTQMIAKGLDFPNVTLVGVITADTTLNLPDFRSREKSFQLLTQVAGRAGRGEWEGRVIIQTFNPDDISIIHAKNQDFLTFYKEEIGFREIYSYPPFSQIIRIVFTGGIEEHVSKGADFFYRYLFQSINNKKNTTLVQILGPNPCGLTKIKGKYRYQLLLKYEKGLNLRPIIKNCLDELYKNNSLSNKISINIDINPNSFS